MNNESIIFNSCITLYKPTYRSGHFPSNINLDYFFENNLTATNDLLPYIKVGGRIQCETTLSCHINTDTYYILIYLEKGSCSISDTAHTVTYAPASLILLSPKYSYSFETLSSQSIFHAYFITGSAINIYIHSLLPSETQTALYHHSFENNNLLNMLTTQLDDLLATSSINALFLESSLLQNLFVQLILLKNASESSYHDFPKHVLKLKKILEERYYESHTLDALQDELKVNKYRLCRDFTKYMHVAPLKYLKSIRIKKAIELLIETDDTIISIGNTVGIQNCTHFIEQFRKEVGLTPLQYRNLHQLSPTLP